MPDWSIPKPPQRRRSDPFNLMRLLGNFVLLSLGLVVVSVILFYVFFNFKGEELIEKNLSAALSRPVRMSYLRVSVPFGLICDDFEIQGLLRAKEMKIQFGLPDFLNQRFYIAYLSLSEPVLSLERTKELQLVAGNSLPEPAPVAEPDKAQEPAVPMKKSPMFIIGKILVQNGKLNFTDLSQEKEFKLSLEDVILKLNNVALPIISMNTDFDFKGALLKSDMPFSGSTVESRGWINYPARNMAGDFKVTEPGGKVTLSAKFNSMANDMTVSGKLKIQNLMAGLKEHQEPEDKDKNAINFEGMLYDSLQSSGVEINADFYFKTKMDKFELGSVSFSGNVGYNVPQKKEEPSSPALSVPLNIEK